LALAAVCLTTPASAQISSFQHIILVIQENRTPDNLFQGLCTTTAKNPIPCSTKPGPRQYNMQTTAWLDNTSTTRTTNPTAVQFGLNYDIMHSHAAFTAMCDLNASGACMMDGAAREGCDPYFQPCPTRAAFGFVNNSTGAVQPYLDLVKAYGWANYMFQTNQGPSYPAHQFLFGATSAPSATDDANGIFAAENSISSLAGCAAPTTTRVWLINPEGVEFQQIFPCFEHQTVADLLEARAVSWRYYGSSGAAGEFVDSTANGIWMAPNSIQHICVAAGQQCTGAMWTSNVEFNPSAILSDISKCNLQGVSWVTPDSFDSDHTGDVRNTSGPSWVASIVNAVETSPCRNPSDGSSYWDSTAIIITWDDWGGWYDHEPPFIKASPQGGYQMGFRVPLIVVSAYTPVGYIHNGREDFGSVIRFVEHNFGIMEGALTFADARGSGDLKEFFSLGNSPRPPTAIKAPLSARYFLKRKPSGLPVDDD
jgi:phospholipase C